MSTDNNYCSEDCCHIYYMCDEKCDKIYHENDLDHLENEQECQTIKIKIYKDGVVWISDKDLEIMEKYGNIKYENNNNNNIYKKNIRNDNIDLIGMRLIDGNLKLETKDLEPDRSLNGMYYHSLFTLKDKKGEPCSIL